jgi:sigma-E factor negative regulatory protein RseA
MTTEDELLSALVDDELTLADTDSQLAALAEEPARRDTWARYQLIGTAIRRGVPEVYDPGLARRIQAAIGDTLPDFDEAEPGLPTPGTASPDWKRTASGIAMAASVAAVALFGVRYFAEPEQGVTVAATGPAMAIQALPVAATETSLASDATLDQERLNDYLIRHNEFAATGGLRGLPPYVRVVSAEGAAPAR